jgi:hypothetical protein
MSERSERVTPQPSDRQGAGCVGARGRSPREKVAA